GISTGNEHWSDVTGVLRVGAATLEAGEMVYGPDFRLVDAMSALELMDPKMDRPGPASEPVLALIESGKLPVDIASAEELLDVIQRAVACEVAWLEGGSLPETLFCALYLHPDAIRALCTRLNWPLPPPWRQGAATGPKLQMPLAADGATLAAPPSPLGGELLTLALLAHALGVLRCCAIARDVVILADLYEEEDFYPNGHGFRLVLPVEDATVAAALRTVAAAFRTQSVATDDGNDTSGGEGGTGGGSGSGILLDKARAVKGGAARDDCGDGGKSSESGKNGCGSGVATDQIKSLGLLAIYFEGRAELLEGCLAVKHALGHKNRASREAAEAASAAAKATAAAAPPAAAAVAMALTEAVEVEDHAQNGDTNNGLELCVQGQAILNAVAAAGGLPLQPRPPTPPPPPYPASPPPPPYPSGNAVEVGEEPPAEGLLRAAASFTHAHQVLRRLASALELEPAAVRTTAAAAVAKPSAASASAAAAAVTPPPPPAAMADFVPHQNRHLLGSTPQRRTAFRPPADALRRLAAVTAELATAAGVVRCESFCAARRYIDRFATPPLSEALAAGGAHAGPCVFARSLVAVTLYRGERMLGRHHVDVFVGGGMVAAGVLSAVVTSPPGQRFVDAAATPVYEWLRLLCLTRVRQRQRLETLLAEWATLQTEASAADDAFARLHSLSSAGLAFCASWALLGALALVQRYLTLTTELELPTAHEWMAIFWYLEYAVTSRLHLQAQVTQRRRDLRREVAAAEAKDAAAAAAEADAVAAAAEEEAA
ncbi:unnamed protein product, partial [Phaeothamnion confervicola]